MRAIKLSCLTLVIICLTLGVIFMTACSPAPPPPAPAPPPPPPPAPVIVESPEPGAVMAFPNVGTSRGNTVIYGSGFEPGEILKIVYYVDFGGELLEQAVGQDAEAKKADERGSFSIKTRLPKKESGIFPIKVYDQEGKTRAVSFVIIEEKKD